MSPLRAIINGITDENVYKRIGWLYASFFGIFFSAAIASYVLLPEGILRGKHPAVQFQLSADLLTSTLQIFGYNLIPIGLIIAASLIAQQSKIAREKFVPLGYTAFWVITLLFALYTGTWSFEVATAAPPLLDRLLRVFDILHRSGLLECSAYILVAATSYKLTLWYSDGKKIIRSRRPREIELGRAERVLFALAFGLLIGAALIESYGIAQLAR